MVCSLLSWDSTRGNALPAWARTLRRPDRRTVAATASRARRLSRAAASPSPPLPPAPAPHRATPGGSGRRTPPHLWKSAGGTAPRPCRRRCWRSGTRRRRRPWSRGTSLCAGAGTTATATRTAAAGSSAGRSARMGSTATARERPATTGAGARRGACRGWRPGPSWPWRRGGGAASACGSGGGEGAGKEALRCAALDWPAGAFLAALLCSFASLVL